MTNKEFVLSNNVPVTHCEECKHLLVYNSPDLYAYCNKIHMRFEPFARDRDTREFFCGYGEREDAN